MAKAPIPAAGESLRARSGRRSCRASASRRAGAPHPHAALLFSDFTLSREGQTLIKERSRVPSSRTVDTRLNKFPFEMIDPSITLDEADKWEKLWSELFLKGQKVQKDVD